MPEGDALYRAAQRLQVLVGERVAAESPNPRAAVKHIAERLDGRRLESVGPSARTSSSASRATCLRSHLRMKGRWRVQAAGRQQAAGRGSSSAARPTRRFSGTARCSSSTPRGLRLGPDILASRPTWTPWSGTFAALSQGGSRDALQVQRPVAGIGNMWMSEALWRARVSPWLALPEATTTSCATPLAPPRLMRGARWRRRGTGSTAQHPGCARAAASRSSSRGQGDDNRTAYWCPGAVRSEGHGRGQTPAMARRDGAPS